MISATRDRLVEDDDRQHQPDGLGQVERLQSLVPLQVGKQAFDEVARRRRGDELEPIVVEHDLLAARRFAQQQVHRCCRRAGVQPLASSTSSRRTASPTANSMAASRSASLEGAPAGPRNARFGAMRLLSTPALLGVAELAAALGVSKQRVTQLMQAGSLPTPTARLRAEPIWRRRAVAALVRGWDRRAGRRPQARMASPALGD